MATISKKAQLLNWMQSGKGVTGHSALYHFGIYRLSSIIHRFRSEGHEIKTEFITEDNERYARYIYISPPSTLLPPSPPPPPSSNLDGLIGCLDITIKPVSDV